MTSLSGAVVVRSYKETLVLTTSLPLTVGSAFAVASLIFEEDLGFALGLMLIGFLVAAVATVIPATRAVRSVRRDIEKAIPLQPGSALGSPWRRFPMYIRRRSVLANDVLLPSAGLALVLLTHTPIVMAYFAGLEICRALPGLVLAGVTLRAERRTGLKLFEAAALPDDSTFFTAETDPHSWRHQRDASGTAAL